MPNHEAGDAQLVQQLLAEALENLHRLPPSYRMVKVAILTAMYRLARLNPDVSPEPKEAPHEKESWKSRRQEKWSQGR